MAEMKVFSKQIQLTVFSIKKHELKQKLSNKRHIILFFLAITFNFQKHSNADQLRLLR
jgi:hypothetical protein